MTAKKKKGRRKFLVRTGVGIGVLLGVTYITKPVWRRKIAQIANETESPYIGNDDNPIIWFQITDENIVELFSPKVEMGQGVFTGMAQIAAEELDVDYQSIVVKHAPSATGNLDQFATGGSTSISSLWKPLRELAATFREMIKHHAAEIYGVDIDTIQTKEGQVIIGNESYTYLDIAKQVDEWKIPDTPDLRPVSEHKFVGKGLQRTDLVAKVKGDSMFGIDREVEGMLYASVVRPDIIDAELEDVDITKAKESEGVIEVIQEKDFIAVVATSLFHAEKAKAAIKATFKPRKIWQQSDIEDAIAVEKGKPVTIQKCGSTKRAFNEEITYQQEYKSPIGAHAQLEPNGALAIVKDGKAEIYLSTQVVKITRDEVADRLGFSKKDVNIIPTFLGGGFGRRLHTPNAMQAAVIAQRIGKPIKCYFTRKEEFQHDTFRPPTHHVLKAYIDKDLKLNALEHNLSSGSVAFGSAIVPGFAEPIMGADLGAWRGGMIQYEAIPNIKVVSWKVDLPFATSWWRSLGLLANTFAIESFLDEVAIETKQDPIEMRLSTIKDDERGRRLRKVIEKVREISDYHNERIGNRAMGFAASTDVNTPVAQVAVLSINEDKIKVEKVYCVIDPGVAINPDQIKAQCEGAINMGLSAALFERMYVEDGSLQPIIYGPYRMLQMRDAPYEIHTEILENGDHPGGVGEPPLGPIGAAVANALYRLTGERKRSMPIMG